MEAQDQKELKYRLVCGKHTVAVHSRKAARNYYRSHFYEFGTGDTVLIHPNGVNERMVADTTGLNYNDNGNR